jgi:hypothetical protein
MYATWQIMYAAWQVMYATWQVLYATWQVLTGCGVHMAPCAGVWASGDSQQQPSGAHPASAAMPACAQCCASSAITSAATTAISHPSAVGGVSLGGAGGLAAGGRQCGFGCLPLPHGAVDAAGISSYTSCSNNNDNNNTLNGYAIC